jgi:hypothetical protein
MGTIFVSPSSATVRDLQALHKEDRLPVLAFAHIPAKLLRLLEGHPKQDDVASAIGAIGDRIAWRVPSWRCRPWLDPGRGAGFQLGKNARGNVLIDIPFCPGMVVVYGGISRSVLLHSTLWLGRGERANAPPLPTVGINNPFISAVIGHSKWLRHSALRHRFSITLIPAINASPRHSAVN